MAYLLTSVSGNLISAASAGYAPTNSAEVSAIASAYQVVSATGTQLYAGTAHITSINSAPISASRAGNAANASMATSAYYDGTGRLISSLPDSAAVSAIASAYQVVSAIGGSTYVTSINSKTVSADRAYSSTVASQASNAYTATIAYKDSNDRYISALPDSTKVSSIASAYAKSAASSKQDSSAMSAYALSADVSGCIDIVSANSATWASASAISAYALSADVSSTIDTVSANSAAWGTQVVTSLSGNANFYNQINSKSISSTVSYKARLDENGNSISALYNTVSAQSANWGGSALALSAGPGIVFNKVGDTLVASADETVLWTGAINTTAQTAAFSEATNNFERVRVYIQAFGTTDQSTETHDLSLVYRTGSNNDALAYVQGVERHSNVTTQSTIYIHFTGAYGLGAKLENGSKWVGSAYTEGVSSYPFKLVKVVGVNRIAGA